MGQVVLALYRLRDVARNFDTLFHLVHIYNSGQA